MQLLFEVENYPQMLIPGFLNGGVKANSKASTAVHHNSGVSDLESRVAIGEAELVDLGCQVGLCCNDSDYSSEDDKSSMNM